MPTGPSLQNAIPWQVLPSGTQPFVQQMNFGQMIGQVTAWNPDCQAQAPIWINEAVRKIYDRRTWFGNMVKGQLVCPASVTTGQATVTLGSDIVQGVGTAWDATLIGRQFRIGYNNPIYTIIAVDPIGQQLQLELQWGSTSITSGYFIIQYYFNLGPNIKYLKNMVNVQLGYRMWCNGTQDFLNAIDPWRQNQNWPWMVAPMPTDPNGNYLVELYPASWSQQAFPFLAYVQPPNLTDDLNTLSPYIRTDVVILEPIAKALTWRGPKKNPYYDATEARNKRLEFAAEVENMAMADECLYRINLSLPGENVPYFAPGGNYWGATHAISSEMMGWGDF